MDLKVAYGDAYQEGATSSLARRLSHGALRLLHDLLHDVQRVQHLAGKRNFARNRKRGCKIDYMAAMYFGRRPAAARRAARAAPREESSAPRGAPGFACSAAAGSAAALVDHANEMSWFFSGTERMRLPVAAKNALSTAGAATKIVGSPTPPQKPPDGMMIDSTFGISAMRIEL